MAASIREINYVASTGNDTTGTGTPAAPYATIDGIVSNVLPGTEVVVMDTVESKGSAGDVTCTNLIFNGPGKISLTNGNIIFDKCNVSVDISGGDGVSKWSNGSKGYSINTNEIHLIDGSLSLLKDCAISYVVFKYNGSTVHAAGCKIDNVIFTNQYANNLISRASRIGAITLDTGNALELYNCNVLTAVDLKNGSHNIFNTIFASGITNVTNAVIINCEQWAKDSALTTAAATVQSMALGVTVNAISGSGTGMASRLTSIDSAIAATKARTMKYLNREVIQRDEDGDPIRYYAGDVTDRRTIIVTYEIVDGVKRVKQESDAEL